jgi:hypothetical protein
MCSRNQLPSLVHIEKISSFVKHRLILKSGALNRDCIVTRVQVPQEVKLSSMKKKV